MAPYRLDVVSLAPQAFSPLLELGVIGRAFGSGIAELHLHNPAISPPTAIARWTMSPMAVAPAWC